MKPLETSTEMPLVEYLNSSIKMTKIRRKVRTFSSTAASIYAVNNRALEMFHLSPLFIEMLFCYQVWHTEGRKNYLTRRSIKAPNQGPPGKADKGESPSFQFRFWVNIFCPQFKSFSQKRLFCSSTIWDFPFMYCRMFSSCHRHQQQASKRGKKIHQNEIHLSLAQFSYLNFFNE